MPHELTIVTRVYNILVTFIIILIAVYQYGVSEGSNEMWALVALLSGMALVFSLPSVFSDLLGD